jgi:hypothetical protein
LIYKYNTLLHSLQLISLRSQRTQLFLNLPNRPTSRTAWAKEGRNPPSKHLSEIAGILGVSAEFLITGKGGPLDPNLESIGADSQPAEKVSGEQTGQCGIPERLVAIIESQQSTIATQSDTLASQHHLIEVMVVGDGKKAKRG